MRTLAPSTARCTAAHQSFAPANGSITLMTSPFSHGTTWVSASPRPRTVPRMTSGVHRPYPADAIEYVAWFLDDQACADYPAWLRWGDYEFGCHLCGTLGHGWRRAGGMLWDCAACRKQSSVTSGTLIDKTRTPLSVWFRAAWMMTTDTYGVSARNLQRTLGCQPVRHPRSPPQQGREAVAGPAGDAIHSGRRCGVRCAGANP
jgi:hypothetical protein